MVYIPDKLRDFVIDRAKGLCEYCQTNSNIVIYMEIDHIRPTSKGGATEPDNLCLACVNCNRAKGDTLIEENELFNPRKDDWYAYFEWDVSGTHLLARNDKARRTISRLNINAQPIVKARVFWVKAGWHPPIRS